jgi:hypothetical protein
MAPADRPAPILDVVDALAVTMVATQAFTSLPFDECSSEVLRGAVLFYDSVMQRVLPVLKGAYGRDPHMRHVFDLIENTRQLAAAVRDRAGLPAVV